MGNLRVVVVDDEFWTISSVENCLRSVDSSIEIVGKYTNAEELLHDLPQLRPDVVFADVRMGKFGGLELVEECRRRQIKCAFIIISGYAEFAYAQRAMANGVLYYIVKPVDVLQLHSALQVMRCNIGEGASSMLHQEKFCENVCVYVREHCEDNACVSLKNVAAHFHVNANWLSEHFRLKMGESFAHYRNRIRVERAKRLLLNTSDTMSSIAEQCGFQDASYFASVFKQYTQRSPLQYRAQNTK